MRIRSAVVLFAVACLLSACKGAGDSDSEMFSAGPGIPSGQGALPDSFVNVTPFTRFSDGWMKSPASAQGGLFDGNYTRLIITQVVGSGDESPSLPYKPRDVLSRWLVGKQFSVNLTVRVSAGLFEATAPIVSLDHKSNSSVGEQWSRPINHTLARFPLFLVRTDLGTKIPEIVIEQKSSMAYSSAVVGKLIEATVNLAKELSPQSAVVTKLSAPTLQAQATAVDNAVSKLLGQTNDEVHGAQDPIRYWNYNEGIDLTLYIPRTEDSFDDVGKKAVGTWRISFEEPSVSIFSDWRICDPKAYGTWIQENGLNLQKRCAISAARAATAVYSEVDAHVVMGSQLANLTKLSSDTNDLGTIANYLGQKAWYKKAMGDLGDAKKAATAAPEFCRNVRSAIIEQKLSSRDADIVTWAAPQVADFPDAGRKAIAADQACMDIIRDIAAVRSH